MSNTSPSMLEIREEIVEKSNKIINFEKLRSKIDYIKKLEKKKKETLAYYLKIQIENLDGTKDNVRNNLQNLEKIQKSIIKIKQISKANSSKNNIDNDKLKRLVNVKKNLSIILEGMGDFINISKKLEEMEILIKDENNFKLIQKKLENLNKLKQSLLKNQKNTENLSKFLEKFEDVSIFENKFINRVLSIFEDFLDLALNDPISLKEALEILNKNDEINKNQECEKRLKLKLEKIVAKRFEDKISKIEDVQIILENINFSVDDLLIIHEKLVPLFPKNFKIFDLMEKCYKEHIQKNILPYIKDLGFLKENPGTLIYLINWLNSYEKLLTKVGFKLLDYQELRKKIKKNMPIFFDHISKTFKKFLDKIATNDDFLFKEDFQQDIDETETPEDVATFLNQQIVFLGSHLNGELFISLFEVWLEQLKNYINNYTEKFIREIDDSKIILFIICINNNQKLMFHLNVTKKRAIELFEDEISKENINKKFADIINFLSSNVNDIIFNLIKICFKEIKIQLIPLLFKEKWEESNPVETILNTVGDYLENLKSHFKNRVHFRIFLKKMLEYYFCCYLEYFIWIVKNAFHKEKICEGFKDRYLGLVIEKENGRKYIKKFLKNSGVLQNLLKRDVDCFEEFYKQFKEILTPQFNQTMIENNEYLFRSLFGNGEKSAPFHMQYLEEATNAVKMDLK